MKRRYSVRNNTRFLLYGRILRAVADKALTAQQVAETVGATVRGAGLILTRMAALRLVHRATQQRSRWHPATWRLGQGDGAIAPTVTIRPSKAGADLVQLAALVRRLRTPTRTKHIVSDVGITHVTACRQLNALHEAGVIYIHDWQRSRDHGGPMACRWQFGIGMEDAPKPAPLSKNERQRSDRRKRRQQRELIKHVAMLAANASVFHQAA